ncbi:hypothetical protein SAMN04488511_11516 [Pedobacter suwonensis]|uniref:Uncharacterized protein n=1 Tax=Pedobacter suwonensis TaxID=332999 RepID=A0A1I0TV59_9SPHI|nr:hypothetical protein [Pedobacter suwonensis]SFA55671.1 hypothetical protein SAMN04488511_11516 [Pedobacter suwonensis]
MSDMNLQLGVQFQLLKTKLVAVYEKAGNDSSFLLMPTNLEEVGSATLGEMMQDLTTAFSDSVDTEKIKSDLQALSADKPESQFKVDNLKFSLKTAYIYVKGNVKEYAFAIDVDFGDAVPDLGFVTIEKLAFKIWNTKKNVVLKQLNLDTIENLVSKLNAPEKQLVKGE